MSEPLEDFRHETRAWLEENCPQSMRGTAPVGSTYTGGGRRFPRFAEPEADSRLWLERMAERGLTAPTWPKEYAGGGLTREEDRILGEELKRIDARSALGSIGIMMFGPTILEYGTEEQKQRLLPPIVRGEVAWCQGYSEPGAGSDLASLQCRCEDRGDHYVVNGQKIWTSMADAADWIFCLVRTDPNAKKHDGISVVLIDMDQPGVRTSPIKLISGASPFCQTFFDDARVEKENLIGPLNGGWTIAKRLLQHERQGISTSGGRAPQDETLGDLAKRYTGEEDGKVADPRVRDRIASIEMNQHCFSSTIRRTGDEAKAGSDVATASSIFKLFASETGQKRNELVVEILGTQGLGWEGEGYEGRELERTRTWLRSKASTIEGGSSEVQLNIIAKRVLGLPD